MKKILVLLTGGTICTALNEEGMLSVSEKRGILLKENYLKSDSPFACETEFVLTENLKFLSENMTVEKWNEILKTYIRYTQNEEYDGIIITHGTDTLGYTASLFSILLSDTKVPVFFVSANAPLNSPLSNGNENFKTSVECIMRGIEPNVYAVYKNISDSKMLIHLASRLTQCPNYSDDFHSQGEIDITDINDENYKDYFEKIKSSFPQDKRKSVFSNLKDVNLKPSVLMIDPFVGTDYSLYDYSKTPCVLHGAYHSGTVCVNDTEKDYGKNSVLYMFDKCFSFGTDVYLFPSQFKKETYETVSLTHSHTNSGKRVTFLYGITKETAYAKLLIAYSVFDSHEKRKEFMETECNFEIIKR